MSRTILNYNGSRVGKAIRVARYASGMKGPKVNLPDLKKFKNILLWAFFLLFASVFIDPPIMYQSALKRYLHTLRWAPLPVGIGFALVAFQRFRYVKKREAQKIGQLEPCDCLAEEWEVEAYKLLPLRSFSRTWGWINGLELPEWSRDKILGSYARVFGCNMAEAQIEDVKEYRCLSEFFRRRLKPGSRPIDMNADVTSPVDGTVLHKGRVNCGMMEQIKGVSYSAKRFLGPNCWKENGPMIISEENEECFHMSCLHNPKKNDLYHIAIYLAPGDYHRFHSPSDWEITFRRHFPGDLLSVNPSIVSWIKDLFVLNERVCYVGNWKHGFFSMTAVGATNVGSIIVPLDKELKTNKLKWRKSPFSDVYFDEKPVKLKPGEDFGEFNMGSTIVLLFEAPKDSILSVEPGQKVQVGQGLFRFSDNSEKISKL